MKTIEITLTKNAFQIDLKESCYLLIYIEDDGGLISYPVFYNYPQKRIERISNGEIIELNFLWWSKMPESDCPF